VANLVDNAIKYGDEAGRVTVEVARNDDGAVIAIVDDGPGIPNDAVCLCGRWPLAHALFSGYPIRCPMMKWVSLRKRREPSPSGHIALRTAVLAASARSGSSWDAVTPARASHADAKSSAKLDSCAKFFAASSVSYLIVTAVFLP
jgi:hypothetical protein